MQRHQAFKYELRPTGEQRRRMRRFAGSCRFVFNRTLVLQKERYEAGEGKLACALPCKALTGWRNDTETASLAEAPVQPLKQALKDLERAWHDEHLIAVPPQYTIRTFPACGHVSADNRQTQAQFLCIQCGYEANADWVGALNIRAAGHAVLACGGTAQ